MKVATDTLEFLVIRLKFYKESKQLSVDFFAKDTDSLHMSSLVRVFLTITLKTSLKVLLYVLEGFEILMGNLKIIVQNIKTIKSLGITRQVK